MPKFKNKVENTNDSHGKSLRGRNKNGCCEDPSGDISEKQIEAKADPYIGELSAELKRETKKETRLIRAGYIWTIICTVYVIISTIVLISQKWVEHTAAYALIGCLILYLCSFCALVYFNRQNGRRGTKQLGYYRRLLSIFKIIANILFITVSVVSMAGMTEKNMGLTEWMVFASIFAIAAIQLILKIWLLAVRIRRKYIGKKYRVEINSFVNGNKRKKKTSEKIKEKTYKND